MGHIEPKDLFLFGMYSVTHALFLINYQLISQKNTDFGILFKNLKIWQIGHIPIWPQGARAE